MGKLTQRMSTFLLPTSVRLAWLNLLRNGRRSLLSVLIIAIAVFALTSAGGYGLYTYESLRESTARDTGHLTLSTPGYFEQDEDMPLSNGLDNVQTLTKSIIGDSDVRGVQPRVYFSGLVSNGSKSTIFMGTGVNEREFDMKGPFLDVRNGQTLSDVKSPRYDSQEPQVMLGTDLARNLKVAVSDWVTLLATTSDGALNAFDFKVQGIYSTGVPELDKRQLYVHITTAQELLPQTKSAPCRCSYLKQARPRPFNNAFKLLWIEIELAKAIKAQRSRSPHGKIARFSTPRLKIFTIVSSASWVL